jgi:hypothetical protein
MPLYADHVTDVQMWIRLVQGYDVRLINARLGWCRIRRESLSRDKAKVEAFEVGLITTLSRAAESAGLPADGEATNPLIRRVRFHQELRRARGALLDGDILGSATACTTGIQSPARRPGSWSPGVWRSHPRRCGGCTHTSSMPQHGGDVSVSTGYVDPSRTPHGHHSPRILTGGPSIRLLRRGMVLGSDAIDAGVSDPGGFVEAVGLEGRSMPSVCGPFYPRPVLGRFSGIALALLRAPARKLARTRRVAVTGPSNHLRQCGPVGPCRLHDRQP